jgi:hypothetical protein
MSESAAADNDSVRAAQHALAAHAETPSTRRGAGNAFLTAETRRFTPRR